MPSGNEVRRVRHLHEQDAEDTPSGTDSRRHFSLDKKRSIIQKGGHDPYSNDGGEKKRKRGPPFPPIAISHAVRKAYGAIESSCSKIAIVHFGA